MGPAGALRQVGNDFVSAMPGSLGVFSPGATRALPPDANAAYALATGKSLTDMFLLATALSPIAVRWA